MSYIKDLLFYIMRTVKIVDNIVCNKQPQYLFLTDNIIIKLKEDIKILKIIDDEIQLSLINTSYNDAVETVKKRYNSDKTKGKLDLMLSIMKNDYNPTKEQVTQFKWKDNQINAINKTMDSINNNKFGFKVPSSGIHCQATGTGKTFISMNIVHETCSANNFDKEMTIIWFTERKSILMNNFYQLDHDNNYVPNKKNYNKWKCWDIIDMSKFILYQFVENNDKKWYDKINKDTNKPKLIIINRTFLTGRERYKYIKKNHPCLIIHDECHSATNETSHNFLTYAKKNWDSSVIGFSATPIRINNKNEYKETDKQKLTEIFGIPNNNTINIISNYDINIAIQDEVILPPKFRWYILKDIPNEIDKNVYMILNENNTKILKENFLIVMKELNDSYLDLPYRKTVAWTKTIKQSNDWQKLFEQHKKNKRSDGQFVYKLLYNVTSYVDHSQNNDYNYPEFEKKTKDCILFCVNKHREGSDIPYLDSCIFLDGVINRSSKEFIQCIGRVLRIFEKKKYGLVIDGFIRNNNELDEQIIIDKIIGYYLIFLNMTLDLDDKADKIEQYNRIKNDIVFDKKNKFIKLKIHKNNPIKIECNEFDWNITKDVFTKILTTKINQISDIKTELTVHDIEYIFEKIYQKEITCASIKYDIWYEFKNHKWSKIDNSSVIPYNILVDMKAEYLKLKNSESNCRYIFYDINFLNKLDENKNLLCFLNGVYNLYDNTFRDGMQNDYISLCTNTNYIPYNKNDMYVKEVYKYFKHIQPKKETREYVLTLLSSFMQGGVDDKYYIWTGIESNYNKLIKLVQIAMGDYASTLPINILSSDSILEIAMVKGKRLCVFQMPKEIEKIRIGLINKLIDSNKIMIKQPFKEPIEFKPQFKLLIARSQLPYIPSSDSETLRKLRVVEFTDNSNDRNKFNVNEYLTIKFEKWAVALMSILIHRFAKYKKNSIMEPNKYSIDHTI